MQSPCFWLLSGRKTEFSTAFNHSFHIVFHSLKPRVYEDLKLFGVVFHRNLRKNRIF